VRLDHAVQLLSGARAAVAGLDGLVERADSPLRGRRETAAAARVAEREHRLADLDLAGVGHRDGLQVGRANELQQRHVVGGVVAEDLRGVGLAGGHERGGHAGRLVDDVVVGEHEAARGDHHAGALGGRAAVLELGGDVDDARVDLFRDRVGVEGARAGVGASGTACVGAAVGPVAVAEGRERVLVPVAEGVGLRPVPVERGDRGGGAAARVVERDGGARAGGGREHRDGHIGQRAAETGPGRRWRGAVPAPRILPVARLAVAAVPGLSVPGLPVSRLSVAGLPVARRWVSGRRVTALPVPGAVAEGDRVVVLVGLAAPGRAVTGRAAGVLVIRIRRRDPGTHVLRWLPAAVLVITTVVVVHLSRLHKNSVWVPARRRRTSVPAVTI